MEILFILPLAIIFTGAFIICLFSSMIGAILKVSHKKIEEKLIGTIATLLFASIFWTWFFYLIW